MADDTHTTELDVRQDRGDGARPPVDPAIARSEIDVTRARMSETIDEIEDALLRKKQRFQSRLDVTAPVRENPIPAAAAALGAGLLLGLLTGGSDEPEADAGDRSRLRAAEERADTWEARARRLMRVARAQEARLGSGEDLEDAEWGDEDEELGDMGRVRDRVVSGVTSFLGSVARDVFAGGRY